jgi:1,4-alpha-glucan branching enzyme
MRFFLRIIFVCLVFANAARSQEPLGAIVNKSGTIVTGVTFRVWAPNATSVVVHGPFNSTDASWSKSLNREPGTTGYWAVTVSNARPGQEYKYVLKRSGDTNDYWKHDPRAVWVRNGNSVIYDHNVFDWSNVSSPNIPVSQQVMYEMHIGSFYDPNPGDGRPGTFDDAIGRLDYLQRLGVNVIALMPVNEFGGDFSWGYNPEHLFAIESAYGGPDALKRFVKAAHARGMKVQLDVVHNHWNPPGDGLWEFDGTNNIYFYPDNSQGWTKWGRRPNYSQPEVRRFIRENIKSLLDDFRVDGFRWDSPQNILGYDANATQTIVNNPQTLLPEGKSLLMEINRLIHGQYPGRWSVAEDADLLTVRPDGSLYPQGGFFDQLRVDDVADSFDGHWQTSFHNEITPQLASATPDLGRILGKVSGWSEPPGYRVIFTDNHDKSGDLNGGMRLADRMVPADPAGKTARKKTLLNAALTLTAPGTPMLWMGQEFHATGTFSDSSPLDWRTATGQHRIFRAHRDLIEMRELLPALQNSNLDASAGFSNDEQDLMAYWRLGTSNADNLVMLFNFSATTLNISCPFPTTGTWYVQFNSDWSVYGSDFGNVGTAGHAVTANLQGSAVRADVPVAAHSVVVLATTPAPTGRFTEDVGGDGVPDGWQAITGASDGSSDDDIDGLSNLFEYQNGLDPLNKDVATVTYNETTHTLRASSNNPVVQHIAWAVDSVSSSSSFTFLSESILGPLFTNPAGAYLRFSLNLTNSESSYSFFLPNTNLDVFDSNRTNWAVFHGVNDFNANPDGDTFTNLQEFARGSDPHVPDRAAVYLAGDQYGGFSPSANPMGYIGANMWMLDLPRRGGVAGEFKFTVGNWSENWGDNAPMDGVGDPGGSNISNDFGQGNGIYRFLFNEKTLAYEIRYHATYAAWIAYHGLTGGDAAGEADPDGDGWSNLAEFTRFTNANGMFMNPQTSDSAAAPKRMTVTGDTEPMPLWQSNASNMTWSDQRMQWEWTGTFSNTTNIQFKFSQATNNSNWTGGDSWGWSAGNSNAGVAVRSGPSNITAAVTKGGRYRLTFQDLAGTYSITSYPVSAEWWESNGLPEPLPSTASDPRWDEDPDGDGFSHRVEYALGGNPMVGDGGLVSSWQTNVGGAGRLVMQWLQRTDPEAGFSVVPLLSTNLSSINWSVLTATDSADTSGVPANYRRREVSVPVEGASKFLRLRVTGP